MKSKILISDPDIKWAQSMKIFFHNIYYQVDVAKDGKDAQLLVYKYKYLAAILDFETRDHECLDVLKYFRLNAPQMKVILTMKDEETFNNASLTDKEFAMLGITDLFIRPYEFKKLKLSLEGYNHFLDWKNHKNSNITCGSQQPVFAADDDFTKIKLENFFSGSFNIFDYFIKVNNGEYLKIFSTGEPFDPERIEKLKKQYTFEYLFFKTANRRTYINFVNEILNKVSKSKHRMAERKLFITENLVEKYIEEIHTVGLAPDLVIQGKEICASINKLIASDINLVSSLIELKCHDINSFGHSFLVTFLSVILANKLGWKSKITIESLALGAMLHDLGKLKLSSTILQQERSTLTQEELTQYQKHPEYGLDLLNNIPKISEPVRQIVYQHHELANGKGFPNKLNGFRIYPMAKIVTLSNYFANLIVKNNITPLEGLKSFITNKDETDKFDAKVIKALVQCFVNK